MIVEENTQQMVVPHRTIVKQSPNPFIEANTTEVDLEHLKNDCIIPVFSKDNESTISHYQFITKTLSAVRKMHPDVTILKPKVRVSHTIKGRVPSAIGKPVKELLNEEKTIYYERCAFVIELPEYTRTINGCELKMSIGGVRAYNQENLYSKKSPEKFKIFVGFQNKVCTNLCISTDGFSDNIKLTTIDELGIQIVKLLTTYDMDRQVSEMTKFQSYVLNETQFAHFVGKLRMWCHLEKEERRDKFAIALSDSQINKVIKDYYTCPNFKRSDDGSIDLWRLYNLFTEANKSTYIDKSLERNVNAYELTQNLANAIETKQFNWFLNN
tara:strand:+ start:26905 stop:27882 length:978 start_codon:yes stop_codon:yes gene_type:complete